MPKPADLKKLLDMVIDTSFVFKTFSPGLLYIVSV